MGALETIISALPIYLAIIFLLSYFIWSKFFNEGKMKMDKKLDDFWDLTMIFLFILSTVSIVFFVSLGFLGIFMGGLNEQGLLNFFKNILPKFIGFMGVILIITLISQYRHKSLSREDFKAISIDTSRIIYSFTLSFLLFYILLCFTSLRHIVIKSPPILLLISSMVLLSILGITHKSLFNEDWNDIIDKKKLKKSLIVGTIVVVLFLIFLVPHIFEGNVNIEGYKITDVRNLENNAYEIVSKEVRVLDFGILGSSIPLIPLSYSKSKLIPIFKYNDLEMKISFLNTKSSENFKTTNDLKELSEYRKSYNKKDFIEKIDLETYNGTVVIKYNRDLIKQENISSILLTGVRPISISKENFSYEDNVYSSLCKDQFCIIKSTIENNLDKPLVITQSYWFGLTAIGVTDFSKCRFKSMSSDLMKDSDLKAVDYCQNNSCDFEYRSLEKGDTLVYLSADIDDKGVVRRNNWKIDSNVQFNLTTVIDCT